MSDFSINPCFIDSPSGRIFVLYHVPSDSAQKGVVLVPPFAEEMNKSRRMFTLVAEALAKRGCHVLLPDFYGTGDSEGDFSDADWEGWLEQLHISIAHMRLEYGINSFSLLGLRSGALLIAEYLEKFHPEIDKLVYWQPVVDGSVYLTQFLRMRLASAMLKASGEKETVQSLKNLLTDGEIVEVAGYGLTSEVTDGLAASSLKKLASDILPPTCWMDVVASEGQSPPLVNRKLVESWVESGASLQYKVCVGEPFWGGVEIIEIPTLVATTCDFVCGGDNGN